MIAFIMPTHAQRAEIQDQNKIIAGMRSDQVDHIEHLIRSWRVFQVCDGINMIRRAIKRTLRDRP